MGWRSKSAVFCGTAIHFLIHLLQTGGRDTAGLGGVGGYKRLWKGGEIKQVPQHLKDQVSDELKEKAREMARQELQRRLEELDMTISEAKGYSQLLGATQGHVASLLDLLESKRFILFRGSAVKYCHRPCR